MADPSCPPPDPQPAPVTRLLPFSFPQHIKCNGVLLQYRARGQGDLHSRSPYWPEPHRRLISSHRQGRRSRWTAALAILLLLVARSILLLHSLSMYSPEPRRMLIPSHRDGLRRRWTVALASSRSYSCKVLSVPLSNLFLKFI